MPDLLNKQAIVNLLIDSPLREPIKINLIDIVNNTNEPDLPKVYSTITKELEIFQKATERRMKLAEETIAKLGGVASSSPSSTNTPSFDLPSLPTPPTTMTPPAPVMPPIPTPQDSTGLSVPTLDLPPLPQMPTVPPTDDVTPSYSAPTPPMTPTTPVTDTPVPPFQPLGGPATSTSSDEDALAEIQKELDSLKSATSADIAQAATPTV